MSEESNCDKEKVQAKMTNYGHIFFNAIFAYIMYFPFAHEWNAQSFRLRASVGLTGEKMTRKEASGMGEDDILSQEGHAKFAYTLLRDLLTDPEVIPKTKIPAAHFIISLGDQDEMSATSGDTNPVFTLFEETAGRLLDSGNMKRGEEGFRRDPKICDLADEAAVCEADEPAVSNKITSAVTLHIEEGSDPKLAEKAKLRSHVADAFLAGSEADKAMADGLKAHSEVHNLNGCYLRTRAMGILTKLFEKRVSMGEKVTIGEFLTNDKRTRYAYTLSTKPILETKSLSSMKQRGTNIVFESKLILLAMAGRSYEEEITPPILQFRERPEFQKLFSFPNLEDVKPEWGKEHQKMREEGRCESDFYKLGPKYFGRDVVISSNALYGFSTIGDLRPNLMLLSFGGFDRDGRMVRLQSRYLNDSRWSEENAKRLLDRKCGGLYARGELGLEWVIPDVREGIDALQNRTFSNRMELFNEEISCGAILPRKNCVVKKGMYCGAAEPECEGQRIRSMSMHEAKNCSLEGTAAGEKDLVFRNTSATAALPDVEILPHDEKLLVPTLDQLLTCRPNMILFAYSCGEFHGSADEIVEFALLLASKDKTVSVVIVPSARTAKNVELLEKINNQGRFEELFAAGVYAVPYLDYSRYFDRASLVVHSFGASSTVQAFLAGKPQALGFGIMKSTAQQPDKEGNKLQSQAYGVMPPRISDKSGGDVDLGGMMGGGPPMGGPMGPPMGGPMGPGSMGPPQGPPMVDALPEDAMHDSIEFEILANYYLKAMRDARLIENAQFMQAQVLQEVGDLNYGTSKVTQVLASEIVGEVERVAMNPDSGIGFNMRDGERGQTKKEWTNKETAALMTETAGLI